MPCSGPLSVAMGVHWALDTDLGYRKMLPITPSPAPLHLNGLGLTFRTLVMVLLVYRLHLFAFLFVVCCPDLNLRRQRSFLTYFQLNPQDVEQGLIHKRRSKFVQGNELMSERMDESRIQNSIQRCHRVDEKGAAINDSNKRGGMW